MAALTIPGVLAAVKPTVPQGSCEWADSSEVGVVTAVFPRQKRVHRVMEVVAPLRVHSISSMLGIAQDSGIVQIALGNQIQTPPKTRRQICYERFQLLQKMPGAKVENPVDRVQAQRVKVEFVKPVQCVLDEKPPYFIAVLTVEIDRLSPGSLVAIGKIWAKSIKVVAFGAKMVVNHVQNHRQTLFVRGIHQPPQRFRTTIRILWSIRINAVVSPIPRSGKLRHWH